MLHEQLIADCIDRFAHEPGGLLPLLHAIQDIAGFIPAETIAPVAAALNLSRAEVHGVISFYHDFRTEPGGRQRIQVCRAEEVEVLRPGAPFTDQEIFDWFAAYYELILDDEPDGPCTAALPPFRQSRMVAGGPIEGDIFILDEVSMVDVHLMHAVLSALDPASCLVLVGDIDQLPSVGPGNVLRDLIHSETIPCVRLQHIFRQALKIPVADRLPQILRPIHRQHRVDLAAIAPGCSPADIPRLQHDGAHPALREAQRGAQPGESGPDDGDIARRVGGVPR